MLGSPSRKRNAGEMSERRFWRVMRMAVGKLCSEKTSSWLARCRESSPVRRKMRRGIQMRIEPARTARVVLGLRICFLVR